MTSQLFAAVLVAFAFQPAPGSLYTPLPATPIPLATPVPNLPEIGRVRSQLPPCAVMRDLVIPSFEAARRADARFDKTSKTLVSYARAVDDKDSKYTVVHEMWLSRLSQDVANFYEDTQKIAKALGDPRFDRRTPDPQVQAERNELEQLYEVQQARANLLSQYVQREQRDVAVNTDNDNSGLASRSAGPAQLQPPPLPLSAPAPSTTARPIDRPVLTGNSVQDEQYMRDWAQGVKASIRYSENEAAKTFYPIAMNCSTGP